MDRAPPPPEPDRRSDDPVDAEDARLLDLLERCFLLLESGREPDVDLICGHDAALATRLRSIIAREREWTAGVDVEAVGADIPDHLGRYELVAEIGRGGMSVVYLARDPELDREVALKVLRAPASADDPLRTRFRREAEITAALEHPNIVPIHEIGEDRGYLYLVMKCLTGPSLAAAGRLAPREVARIGAKLCRALNEAHLSGVIHRDVKPSNILLDGDEPVLLDFGLAYGLGDVRLTQAGTAAGTVLYMSPEQVAGRVSALDPRTDLYSLGATLYEAAEGRPTIAKETPLPEIMRRIELHDAPATTHLSRDPDLETILRRAMQKDPERRFGTAAEMAEDLERYLRGEPIRSARSSLTSRLMMLSRRHRAASTLALVLGAVIGFLLIALATNRYAQRRLFAADLARAHEILVREGDTGRARELLVSLRSRGAGTRVDDLERSCAAFSALDRFFDVVHEIDATRSVYDASVLRGMVERLPGSGALEVRRPWSDCVLALALHHLGDHEEARARLDAAAALRTTRAVLALRALVDGTDPAEALNPAADTEVSEVGGGAHDLADDHVLVAVALRLAGAPPRSIRDEIERAMELRRDHYRAREALALLERREGNHAKALGLFLGLVTTEGYRPVTLLHQAYEALLLGDLELAERCLSQVPSADRDARHALMKSQLLRRRGRIPEAVALGEAACRTWPEDSELRVELGNAELLSGLTPRAVASFRAALEAGPREFVRERVVSTLAACELQALLNDAPRDVDIGVELNARAAQWNAAAGETSDPIAASDYYLIVARSRRLLGQDLPAWDALNRAIDVDPENHAASTTFALWAAERVINERMQGIDPAPYGTAALRRAEHYTEQITSGSLPPGRRGLPDQCRQDAWYAAFLLAWCRGEDETIDHAYRQLSAEAPYYWETQRDSIEQLFSERMN